LGGWLLAGAAAGFWVGILLTGLGASGPGLAWGVALLSLGMAGLAAVALSPVGRHGILARWVAGGVCFALLGAGWAALREARRQGSPLAALAGRTVEVWGTLDGEPRPGTFGWTASVRTELVLSSWPGRPVALGAHDPLWLQGRGPAPKLSPGVRVWLKGTLVALRDEFGAHLRRRGYPATLSVATIHERGPPTSLVIRAAHSIRSRLRGSLARLFPEREAGLLMGLLLGDTSRLDVGVEEDFRATGLTHLTAASGQNLAMFLAPLIGLAMSVGLGRWGRLAVGLAGTGFFVLLAGAQPSVQRAAAMAGFTLIGIFLGRPRSPPAILGGAVLVLLAINPALVYAPGFQLSVGATAGIALLAGPLSERLRFLPKGISLAAAATLGAQAGVTPLLLYHFGIVPVVSIPANLLAFPAVAPAMLLGLAAGAIGLAWHGLGALVASLARAPLSYLGWLADRLARSPLPSVTSPGRQVLALLVGLLIVAAVGWWLRSRRRIPRWSLAAAAVIAPLFLWSSALRSGPPGALTLTFFDVGQGDAALVRSPEGASILIDGGPDPDAVLRKLAALGVRRLDLVVATHHHADHVGGLPSVLARLPVALVIDSGCPGDSPWYTDLVRAIDAAGVLIRHPRSGSVLRIGDIKIEVLGPDGCFTGTESDANNDSLVLRVTKGSASVLFTGDVEEPAQQDMLREEMALLPALVLKVPHHGGDTSIEEFFLAVGARVGVVSVGANRYGHPSSEVLADLASRGTRVFRTDHLGDVTVTFRGSEVLVASARLRG
jgi:competence protein ComEC